VAVACEHAASSLARMAVDETRMGRYEDKVTKNLFSAVDVRNYILPLKTCGVIREVAEARVRELAVPMGVVAALIPTTNPTSTAIYKALIAVKARNAIVMSPHPRATECVVESCRIMQEAARAVGAPDDLILSMATPTLDGTNELMQHRHTAVILATGGYGGRPTAPASPRTVWVRGTSPPSSSARPMCRKPWRMSSRERTSITVCCARQRTRSSAIARSKRRCGRSSSDSEPSS
jgi:acyl-CoA reductase-like NAD-dependent aldehyde dehydrogenase